jgi:hypothetical protein
MSVVSTYDEIPSRNALIFAMWQNSLAVVAHARRRSKKACRRCGHRARRAGTVRLRYPGDEARRGARLLDAASAAEPKAFGVAGLPPRASGFLSRRCRYAADAAHENRRRPVLTGRREFVDLAR